MPRIGDIAATQSQYLKLADVEQRAGAKWYQGLDFPVTVQRTSMGEYPDGSAAYLLHFAEFEKPYGCNKTALKVLTRIVGEDVLWEDSSKFAGLRLAIYGEDTEKGAGIRLRVLSQAPPPAASQASAQARQQIHEAQVAQGVPATGVTQDQPLQEPENFVDPQDPGVNDLGDEVGF